MADPSTPAPLLPPPPAPNPPTAFAVKDCTLVAIGTGRRARDLRELRDQLLIVHPGCIFNHFWGPLLYPRFENPEFLNDFAEWVRRDLHDLVLSERLGVIDPTEFATLDALREELVNIIDERLDELEVVPWSKPDRQFSFIRSQIVVFDTHTRIEEPKGLVEAVPKMSIGSIFYHFIDARRRQADGVDDFRAWLRAFGEPQAALVERLGHVDPYFAALHDLREELALLLAHHFREGQG